MPQPPARPSSAAPPDDSRRAAVLRVGLVGYGLAGTTFHAPFITTTPGLALAAVVTRDAGRRAQATRAHPGVHVVDTVDALLARADTLDVVVVASPNRSHGPVARAALDAGLPVVVDKPLAPTTEEALALVRHARERGRMLTVYQNRRWDGDFVTLQALLREGALGDVRRFETRFERWRPVPKGGWREAADPAEGGGLLLDLGSHLVDQALLLFGAATHVYAELERRRDGMAVEDDVFLAIKHASGVRTHAWLSAVAAQGGPRFRVLGSRAAWVKHGLDPQEAALKAGLPADGEGWGVEAESSWGTLGNDDAHVRRATARGDYGGFYAGVVAALRDGAPPPVDPMDAVRTLAVLDAARTSARDGEVVRVASPGEPSEDVMRLTRP